MVSLSAEITIPSPPSNVWPLLSDPTLVASCVPGATLTRSTVNGVYQGTLRVKLGPTLATFRGEAKVTYDHDARLVTIEGRGIDGRGQSRAAASGAVSASGGETTVLKVQGNFSMTGPLETLANAEGAHVARALLAEFAQNMAQMVRAEGAPAPEADAIPIVEPESVARQVRAAAGNSSAVSPPAEPRGAARLLRDAASFLRQVISRQGRGSS